METKIPRFYEFGNFKLDSRRRILTKNSQEISISAKNFELLFFLLKNEGKILSHEELLEGVWEGTFVEQSNLKKGISALRQILGEKPENSLFIKTVPRKGYSFIAPVKVFSEEAETFSLKATEIIIEEEIIEEEKLESTEKLFPIIAQKTSFWTKRNIILTGILSTLLLGGLVVVFRGYFTKQGRRFSADKVKITKITNDGNCGDASISADGNFILCGYRTDDGFTLITRQISAKSQVELLPPQKNISFWSYKITPDGSSVYYFLHDTKDASRDGLFQIPFLGGTPRKINNSALHIAFSPDSKKLGFIRIKENSNQIFTADLDGNNEKMIAEYGEGHRLWGLTWSPDGKYLLCSARLQSNEKFTGFVDEISLENGHKERIFEANALIVSATWMPDKTSIILGMRELNSEIRQIWQYFPSSKELIRVTNDNNIYRFPVLNQAGTIISVSQEANLSGIYFGERDNKQLKTILSETGMFSDVSKTADGRFIYNGYEDSNEAVWIMNTDSSKKQKLTDSSDGTALSPRLSNDKKTVVFSSMRSGRKELWRINFDSSGLSQLTQSTEDYMINGKLMNDGQTLIGNANGKSGNYLWQQKATGEKTVLAEKIGGGWDLSPDDKLLVYNRYNEIEKKAEIIVRSIETGETLQTYDVAIEYVLKWNSNDSFIYATREDNKIKILQQKLSASSPILVYQSDAKYNERISSFELLEDEKSFVFIRGKYLTDAVTIKIDDKFQE